MPLLTAPPREALTADEVLSILTGEIDSVGFGCDLLDFDLNVVDDLSADVRGGRIKRNMAAKIHGTCTLELSRRLTWGSALVRPTMTLRSGALAATFRTGVYLLTTPERTVRETPESFSCKGYDRIYLLDREVGESYSILVGTTYKAALEQVFADAGLTGYLIDSAAADRALPVTRNWPLVASSTDPDQTDTPVTWLRIVNDLQEAWNGRAVWADDSGFLRCQAYKAPIDRPDEFTFDVDTDATRIVGSERNVIENEHRAPNRWVFLWSNRPGGMQEVEGDGMHVYDLPDEHDLSAVNRRAVWPRVIKYEAASQAVLEELGARRVADDLRVAKTIKATTGPFPVAGHADVFALVDSEIPDVTKVQALSWEYELGGSDVEWTWEAVA